MERTHYDGYKGFMDEDEVKEIIDFYMDKTVSVKELIETYKIGHTKLYAILDKHNIPLRQGSIDCSHRLKLTDDQVREARKRYSEGEKHVPLAKEFGVSSGTMFNAIKGRGHYKYVG